MDFKSELSGVATVVCFKGLPQNLTMTIVYAADNTEWYLLRLNTKSE